MPDAELVEAVPDLVGLTDVASIMGFSRQNMRQLVVTGGPVPTHEGRPSLWHLTDMLRWLSEAKGYRVPEELAELAEATRQLNLAVAAASVDSGAQADIHASLG